MNILVFGNSGSGKSTLARRLAEKKDLAHLDLDTIAWQNVTPPQRAPLHDSERAIKDFNRRETSWVIEGCYADLLKLAVPYASNMIYLNLPISACIDNARRRAWEPHKYASKELQDRNLPMLIDWITDYESRDDTFSAQAHLELFDRFNGKKVMYTSNSQSSALLET